MLERLAGKRFRNELRSRGRRRVVRRKVTIFPSVYGPLERPLRRRFFAMFNDSAWQRPGEVDPETVPNTAYIAERDVWRGEWGPPRKLHARPGTALPLIP